MNLLYKRFYREMFLKTNGFIPSKPIDQNLYPGDFFQIRNGKLIVLGNIFREALVDRDDIELEYEIKLNSDAWSFRACWEIL